jgi:5-methylthioadenosine/S-adenosylhomocysteine deaminase
LLVATPVAAWACGHDAGADSAQPGVEGAVGGESDVAGQHSSSAGNVDAPSGGARGGGSTGAAGEMGVGGAGAAAAGDNNSGGEGGTLNDPCLAATAPSIERVGEPGRILLRGMVVTPDEAFAGEVLVVDDTISCVAASCAAAQEAPSATVVETRGIIFPGLIDTHNHVLFDTFDETDWSPLKTYGDHNQWTNEPRYAAMLDAKQYLNGEGSSPVDYGCELDKYGELKGLVAGTTSIVGAANPANRTCFGTLARTIDQTPNGLGADQTQVATLFPDTTAADGVCTNVASGKTDAYLIHVAEGTDDDAKNEFDKLNTITTTDGCLYEQHTAVVHGTALGDPEFTIMAAHQMSLVWSPRSEVFLYGAGTDLTKTTNVSLALSKGINVALGPDWSLGGSQNLLDELRFARQVSDTTWDAPISSKALVQMVTTNAARVLGLQGVLGSIEVGKKADLMVIGGNACAPYDSLLASTPADVQLVLVGGQALYGHPALQTLGPAPGCEALDVCGKSKFVCVATPSQSPTDKFGQTLGEIQSTLSSAIDGYDALNLSQWRFAPITPLVRCE